MADIYIAIAILGALSIGAFVITARVAREWSGGRRVLVLAATVGAIAVFSLFVYDRLMLARVLPVSSVVVLGNVVPLLAAVVVALVWTVPGPGKLRRVVLLAMLLLATGRMLYRPLMGEKPLCGDAWEDEVCMQTTEATCGAAAAATLLSHYGVDATESEMVDLCLTRQGTLRLGLYRGLRLKSPADRRVEVIRGDLGTLRSKATEPMVIFVGLRRGQKADPRYARDWGWTPGLRHAVVLFGFTDDGMIDIGDPTHGREKWKVEALDVLWDGYGIRLSPRG